MTARSPQPDATQPDITQPNVARIDQPQVESIASPSRLPGWRLWVPLLIQAGLIAFVPAQDAYTYATGTLVTLKTAPVDPYDLVRGYSQMLGYEISDANRLSKLPGGDWFAQNPQGSFYLVLQAPSQTEATPPSAWQPVRISGDRPANLAANQIALRGRYEGQIMYGLERFYMPEDQRQQINQAFADARQQTVMQAKIDDRGNAVLVNLWLGDRALQF